MSKTTAIGSNFKMESIKFCTMNELKVDYDLIYKQLEMFQKSQGKSLTPSVFVQYNYAPTLEKLRWHIGLGLSVHPSVHLSLCP